MNSPRPRANNGPEGTERAIEVDLFGEDFFRGVLNNANQGKETGMELLADKARIITGGIIPEGWTD